MRGHHSPPAGLIKFLRVKHKIYLLKLTDVFFTGKPVEQPLLGESQNWLNCSELYIAVIETLYRDNGCQIDWLVINDIVEQSFEARVSECKKK